MRKLKLQVQMSVDGFIAGPQGEMDWMVWNWDDQLKNYVKGITDPVDCILIGRKLAQGFIPHWASHPDAEGADKINNTPKVVFTKTLRPTDPAVAGWKNTTLATGDLVSEVNQLKNKNGKDIMVYGGANFVGSLIQHGLIDDFHLFINPTAIGNGMPIFRGLTSNQNFVLKKATSFSSGMVVLNYELTKN